jgi:hypothetical protein
MEELIINEFDKEYFPEKMIFLILFMVVFERVREKLVKEKE